MFTSTLENIDENTADQAYSDLSERSKLQLITDEHTITKCEQSDNGIEKNPKLKKQSFEIDHAQDQQNQEFQIFGARQLFENRADTDIHLKKVSYQQHQLTSCSINRFRSR